ncbi:MAG: hypothetical protein ACP5E2_14375 [Terracidiphilus sp.]
MEQQTNSTAGTTTQAFWIIEGTVVFRQAWTWAGPSPQKQSVPEPPVRGGQYQLFADDELRAVPLPDSEAQKGQALVSAESDDDEPAHEDLRDPVVARFVDFRLPTLQAHDGRKGDVRIAETYDAISPYLVLKKIYSALIWTCREQNAEKIAEGVWRIEVSHTDLASAADCSARSIRDATRELAAHGYILRHPEKWGGGHSSQYYVRDDAEMMTILRAAGAKFARKMGQGHIKLYRPADELQDDTIARI